MDWKVTTQPTAEPIYLDAAKLHCKVESAVTADDTLITNLIKVARKYVEAYQNKALIAQTITARLDRFSNTIVLPMPPLISVSSVKYYDTDGNQQTLGTSYYDVDTTSQPGKITLGYNDTWPVIQDIHHAIEIIYYAGYAVPCTADASADTLTVSHAVFSDADIVRVQNSGGALPTGLSANTDYHVRDVSGSTLKLAATAGGAAIDLTGTGSGLNFIGEVPENVIAAMLLIIGHLYEHRSQNAELTLKEIPMAAESLLSIDRLVPVV